MWPRPKGELISLGLYTHLLQQEGQFIGQFLVELLPGGTHTMTSLKLNTKQYRLTRCSCSLQASSHLGCLPYNDTRIIKAGGQKYRWILPTIFHFRVGISDLQSSEALFSGHTPKFLNIRRSIFSEFKA